VFEKSCGVVSGIYGSSEKVDADIIAHTFRRSCSKNKTKTEQGLTITFQNINVMSRRLIRKPIVFMYNLVS
jgi:hypothetical protein